jgi:hypothetical protein
MHDLADLEARGIPSVGVATTEFVEAAAAQADALGYHPAMVFIPHPVQDRTDAELAAMADASLEAIIKEISQNGR